jgi:hypothetical protein
VIPGTKMGGTGAAVDFPEYFPPKHVKIEIDLNNGPQIIPFIIHELVHVVMSELIRGKFDETLEEVLIVAWATFVSDWVMASKTRKARWQKVLDRKLVEYQATLEDVPYEEQVAR